MSNEDIRRAVDARAQAVASRIGRPSFATVVALDTTAGMVRVELQPSGAQTGWISDYAASVGSVSVYTPSSIGSQVVVVPMDGGGDEFSIVARCHDAVSPPRASVATGKTPVPGESVTTLEDGTEIYIGPGSVVVTGKTLKLVGDVSVTGNLAVSGAVTGESSATFASEVKGNGIPLSTHTHSVPQGGNTGAPNA